MGTLLLVHAHPDDEAISTGGVMCMAREEGHRVVLITATRGEEGEINNMDEASVRPRIAEVRTAELAAACRILDVSRSEFLGYRDSGMAGTGGNQNPASFHMAPMAEAAERLAVLLREERPDVVVTYSADGIYGHPDHIKAQQVTMAALDLLKAEGWEPRKTYQVSIPREQLEQFRKMAQENGQERGVPETMLGVPTAQLTTFVDVKKYIDRKRDSFRAHLSQNNPNGPFATMASQLFELAFGTECFELVRGEAAEPLPETNLFAGIS